MNKNVLYVLIISFASSHCMDTVKPLYYGYCLQENGKGSRTGTANSIEWRQEDTVKCVEGSNNNLFVSLFDGHGGSAISTFLRDNFYDYFNEAHLIYGNTTTRQFLESAFKLADLNTPQNMEDGFDLNGIQGSTALVGYFQKTRHGAYECTIAWVGDSRAVVQNKNNNTVLLETIDHTPAHQSERERITKAGGVINIDEGISRVNGLSVSRALGNKELNRKLIIQTPDIEQLTLTSEDGFVIFASDGIWNKISSQDAIDIVASAMTKSQQELDAEYPQHPTVTWGGTLQGEQDPIQEGGNNYLKRIARVLCYKAREKGSSDNISVIIVSPDGENKSMETAAAIPSAPITAVPVAQNPHPDHQSWWSSQSPSVKKYIMGLSAALGLTALGSYFYYKFYRKN